MGRRKVYKKYRQKYRLQFTLLDSTGDKINLVSEYKNLESSNVSDISISDTNSNICDEKCTQEFIMTENKQIKYYEGINLKMNLRLPKLNLDIPENDDMDDVNSEKNGSIKEEKNQISTKVSEKTLLIKNFFENDNKKNIHSTIQSYNIHKYHSIDIKNNFELVDPPKKELTLLNEYFQIPSTFNLRSVFVEPQFSNFLLIGESINNCTSKNNFYSSNCHKSDNIFKINDYAKNTLPSENCEYYFVIDDELHEHKEKNCCIILNHEEKLESLNKIKVISNLRGNKAYWNTLENVTYVNFPVIKDTDSAIRELKTRITILNNISEIKNLLNPQKKNILYFYQVKNFLIKLKMICNWITEQIITWMKKGREKVKNLLSIIFLTFNPSLFTNNKLVQLINLVKCDNERLLLALSDKVSLLTQDLKQIQNSNETILLSLKSEVNGMETVQTRMNEINDKFIEELKIMQEKIDKLKLSLRSEFVDVKTTVSPLKCVSIGRHMVSSPPPPPPLPPSPPRLFLSRSVVSNTRNSYETPKKYMTSINNRPVITAEDLTKVTLKKVPPSIKDNQKNTVPGPKGPFISLDMLRNVKLKSAKRRSLDQHKSPRSASRLKINRSHSNLSLSPIMLGAEGSLGQLLKPIETSKRVFKRTRSISSNSEVDLSTDTPSSMFKLDYFRSEPILS